MSATYDIVPYEPAFRERVCRLQQHLWGGDVATNTAYLNWKYEQNPYIDDPLICLALYSGRVVGMRGMFGSCWEIGSPAERVVLPCADDFVIAPDHRNRGLVSKIMSSAIDGVAGKGYRYAFALSASAVTMMASFTSGWRGAGSMRAAQRNRPVGLLGRVPAGLRAGRLRNIPILWRYADALARLRYRLEGPPFARLDHPARLARASLGAGVRVETAPRVDEMAELVRRVGHDGRIRHIRDESYLAWRYRNPLHEYRFLFRGGDRLEGYLVLQAYRRDPERGINMVDWAAMTPDIYEDLLRAAVDTGDFPKLIVWTATMPSESLAVISRAGFVPVGSGSRMAAPTLLVCDVRRPKPTPDMVVGGRRLLDPASWDMRMVYSMAG